MTFRPPTVRLELDAVDQVVAELRSVADVELLVESLGGSTAPLHEVKRRVAAAADRLEALVQDARRP